MSHSDTIQKWDRDLWSMVDSYFQNTDNYLSKNQLDSYNRFIEINLPKTVRQFNPLVMSYLPSKELGGYLFEIHVTLGGSIEEVNKTPQDYKREEQKEESPSTLVMDNGALREVINKKVVVVNDGLHIYVGKPIIQELYTTAGEVSTEGLHQKPLYPNEARLKNITYRSELLIDVIIDYRVHPKANQDKVQPRFIRRFEKVPLGFIPIMVQSKICSLYGMKQETIHQMGECEYDHGGYFIIDGKEKVIVAQERQIENKIYVNEDKDAASRFKVKSEVRSTPEHRFQPARITNIYVAKRTVVAKHTFMDENDKPVYITNIPDFQEDGLYVSIPMVDKEIPLFVLFRALGIVSDLEIIQKVLGSLSMDTVLGKRMVDFIEGSKTGATVYYKPLYVHQSDKKVSYQREIDTAIDARHYIAQFISPKMLSEKITDKDKRLAYLDIIFKEHLFPHVGILNSEKAEYLGYMAFEVLLCTLGVKKFTDRDSYMYKRVDLAGYLVASLFRDLYFRVKNKLIETCNINFNNKQKENKLFWTSFDNDSYFWRDLPVSSDFLRYQFYRFIGSQEESQTVIRIDDVVSRDIMDDGFMYAFKNAWGLRNAPGNKEGVVQDLARLSYVGFVSHLRRINTPLPASAKVRAPHALHMSSWGIMCPSETPDGGNIGLRKNLSIFAVISSGSNSMTLLKCMVRHGLESITQMDADKYRHTRVFLNERVVGYVRDPMKFAHILRLLKRNAIINVYTSISFNIEHNWIKVNTDSGRGMRPVLVVREGNELDVFKEVDRLGGKTVFETLTRAEINWLHLVGGFRNNNKKIPFNDQEEMYLADAELEDNLELLEEMAGVIEYIDKDEEEHSMIAVSIRDLSYKQYPYHYCEIHPSLILGLLANCVPFIEMNPGPRHLYAVGQSKQALGMYASNFRNRMDTKGQVMYYPQRSIVRNRLERYLFTPDMPNGINAIVAIGCFSGYNQEDSIIFNKASVERGLFRTVKYRTYTAREEIENGKIRERIMRPSPGKTHDMKPGNYGKLDENGIVMEGSKITENDILIGKCAISGKSDEGEAEYVDTSDYVRRNEDGFVDKVYSNIGNEGQRYVKIRVRKDKKPELGDKFCSRYGQKGTVGMLMEPWDMPMTAEGMQPDLIVNAHAFPSRMTIAQFLELILGKSCVELGLEAEIAAFSEVNPQKIGDSLQKVGFERYGHQVMYNGRTGEMLNVNYFIGPTYYQRLTHQVSDKYQARDDGSRTALTHQPVGGRAMGGGGRIGEMERDALLSHGVASFLKESLMERSDKSTMTISQNSGILAVYNPEKQIYRDFLGDEVVQEFDSGSGQMIKKVTESNTYINKFATLEVPYSFKLLLQEIEVMGTSLKMITENKQLYWKDTKLSDVDKNMMKQFETELSKFPIHKIKSRRLLDDISKTIRKYLESAKQQSVTTMLDQMKKDKQIVPSKYHAEFNQNYIRQNEISYDKERANSRIQEIVNLLNAVKGDVEMNSFLDVGASDGTITRAIAEYWKVPRENAHGIDIDLSPYLSREVQERVSIKTYPSKNYTGYAAQSMDFIFYNVVLHHVPLVERIPLLHEMNRILKPGGYIVFREHDVSTPRESEEWQFIDAVHAIHMMAKNENIQHYYAEYFSKEQLTEYMSMTGFTKVQQTKPTGSQALYWGLYQKPLNKSTAKAIDYMNREWIESLPVVRQMKYHTIYYNASKDDIEVVLKSQIKQTDDVERERNEITRERVVLLLEYKKPNITKIKKPTVTAPQKSIRITVDAEDVEKKMQGGDPVTETERNIPYAYNPEEEAQYIADVENAVELKTEIQGEMEQAHMDDVKVIEGTSLPEFIDLQVQNASDTPYTNNINDTIEISKETSFGFEPVPIRQTKERDVLDLDMEDSDEE